VKRRDQKSVQENRKDEKGFFMGGSFDEKVKGRRRLKGGFY